ncbi:hypothetical protein PV04_04785 [Phialophora macrospora]|uniref:Peptidase C14 caspase domain-containing protein n=1 Tax=Phialophora macrospora TaxID=1851006 RepID=A0A0D2FQP6_9EURO|nr:hypothetical protein PV04_04785 [Phialophora macrospora]
MPYQPSTYHSIYSHGCTTAQSCLRGQLRFVFWSVTKPPVGDIPPAKMPYLSPTGHDLDLYDSDSTDSGSESGNAESLQTTSSALQEYFAAEMQDLAQKRGHKRVGVLLLQWNVEDESFMDTREEVRSLRRVLEEQYRFSVYEKYLHTRDGTPARHQLNCHLAEFVRKEDDKNALLIVYYAGHGRVGKGKLWLEGGNPKKGKRKISRILWEEVEHQLERARADLLVIFDCCYAGLLANDDPRAAPPRRIFEYLGATLHNKTAIGPGDWSFTKALVWALEQLAHDEPDGFTTSQLKAKIRKAPNFRDRDQEPVWSPRGKNPSLFRLKISPLEENSELSLSPRDHRLSDAAPANEPPEDNNQVYLQLQLAFDRVPSKGHISILAESLKDTVRYHDLPLKQDRWKGLSAEDVRMDFRRAALVKLIEVVSHNRRHGSVSISPAIIGDEIALRTALPQRPVALVSQTTTATAVLDNAGHQEVFMSKQSGQPSVDKVEQVVVAARMSGYSSGRWSYSLAFLGGFVGVFCIFAACVRHSSAVSW